MQKDNYKGSKYEIPYIEEDWDWGDGREPDNFHLHINCPICKQSRGTNIYGFGYDYYSGDLDKNLICDCGAVFEILSADRDDQILVGQFIKTGKGKYC